MSTTPNDLKEKLKSLGFNSDSISTRNRSSFLVEFMNIPLECVYAVELPIYHPIDNIWSDLILRIYMPQKENLEKMIFNADVSKGQKVIIKTLNGNAEIVSTWMVYSTIKSIDCGSLKWSDDEKNPYDMVVVLKVNDVKIS